MTFDRVDMGLRPTQGDEKRLLFSNRLYGSAALPFVIPSAAEGSAVPRTFLGNVFRRSDPDFRNKTPFHSPRVGDVDPTRPYRKTGGSPTIGFCPSGTKRGCPSVEILCLRSAIANHPMN
jgi:hypothetical protein